MSATMSRDWIPDPATRCPACTVVPRGTGLTLPIKAVQSRSSLQISSDLNNMRRSKTPRVRRSGSEETALEVNLINVQLFIRKWRKTV